MVRMGGRIARSRPSSYWECLGIDRPCRSAMPMEDLPCMVDRHLKKDSYSSSVPKNAKGLSNVALQDNSRNLRPEEDCRLGSCSSPGRDTCRVVRGATYRNDSKRGP